MVKRLVLFISFLTCTIWVNSYAQKPKTANKPKTSQGVPGSTAGYRSVKVPVFEAFQLGMTRKEFDSTLLLGTVKLGTLQKEYTVMPYPRYFGQRVFAIEFILEDSIFEKLPEDIFQKYIDRHGTPDSSSIIESTELRSMTGDTANTKQISVSTIYAGWRFMYHNMTITGQLADWKNGIFTGTVRINFSGNSLYFGMLQELKDREGK